MDSETYSRDCSLPAGNASGIMTQHLAQSSRVNNCIQGQYYRHANNDSVTRSHYFRGRFENIYMDLSLVPGLTPVLSMVEACAQAYLQLSSGGLRIGYWFNDMKPGDSTTLHCHDEFDELLSGVYYVCVPEGSGSLLIHDNDLCYKIEPREGTMVFFAPERMHEVLENKSRNNRISVGFNVGKHCSAERLSNSSL